MAQRNSGYARLADDLYITPAWVWNELWEVEPWARDAFDCPPVERNGYDFLTDWGAGLGDIACNPPYGKLAERFVRHALDIRPERNMAMLLPMTWDCASKRIELFTSQRFRRKYVLTKRIKWDNIEHTASPSTNHAWFIWRAEPRGFIKPTMGWL